MSDATKRLRFLKKVRKGPDCWIWIGAFDRRGVGYGRLANGDRRVRAHRIAYELFIGPIPDGLFVCHRCDNPPCVNPEHLFLGTPKDNSVDAQRKGRIGKGPVPQTVYPLVKVAAKRLSVAEAAEIRRRYGSLSGDQRRYGATSGRMMAREFGVSHQTIYRIIHGQWEPPEAA